MVVQWCCRLHPMLDVPGSVAVGVAPSDLVWWWLSVCLALLLLWLSLEL